MTSPFRPTNPFAAEPESPAVPAPTFRPTNPFANEEQAAKQEAARVRSMVNGVQHSPDQAAEAVTLSRRTGVPADVALRNLDPLRQMSSAAEFDADTFVRDTPITASWVGRNEVNAAIAKDDLESLTETEKLFGRNTGLAGFFAGASAALTGAPTAALLRRPDIRPAVEGALTTRSDRGMAIAMRGQLGQKALTNTMTEQDRIDLAAVDALLAQPQIEVDGFGALLAGTAEIIPSMGASILGGGVGSAIGAATLGTTGLVLGGPVGFVAGVTKGAAIGGGLGAFATSFSLEGGNATLDFLAMKDEQGRPMDPAVARVAGASVGLFAGSLDALSFGVAAQTLGSGFRDILAGGIARALRQEGVRQALVNGVVAWGKTVGTEVLTETAQQGVALAGEQLAREWSNLRTDTEFTDIPGGRVAKELAETAAQTFVSMALIGVPGGAMRTVADLQQINQAKQDGEVLTALAEQAGMSKLRQRDPAKYEELVRLQTPEGLERVGVDAERLTVLLQEQSIPLAQFAEIAGIAEQDVAEALARGGDVYLPMPNVLARLVGTPVFDAMKMDLKLRVDGLSQREADEQAKTIEADMAEVRTEMEAIVQNGTEDASGQRVIDDVVAQITAAVAQAPKKEQFTPENIEQTARAIAAFFITTAQRTGQDAFALYQSRGYKIVGRETAEPLYNALVEAQKLEKSGKNPERLAELRGTIAALRGTMSPEDVARMEQAAFHGTPYTFDKFSLDKIGTGEGAQAYGWGLYFAEEVGIADTYRRQLSREATTYEGESVPKFLDADAHTPLQLAVGALLNNNMNREMARGSVRIAFGIPSTPELKAKRDDAVRLVGEIDESKIQAGALYRVDIPDEAVARMLDWDKVVSPEQAVSMRGLMRKASVVPDSEGNYHIVRSGADASDAALLQRSGYADKSFATAALKRNSTEGFFENLNGESAYKFLVDTFGNQREASLALLAAGIPGIKYLDAGSRGAGDGTRNLVVFDENLVTITHRNGEPVTAQERTDFLAQEAMPEQVTTGDLGTMNVARGQRVTADNVVLTADEEKAVASAVKDIKRLLPKLKPAMTKEDVAQYVREVKAAFPESDGWAPLEFKGLDASQTNKGNNGKIEYKWGNVSYSFNRALDSAQGLKVGTPEYEAQVTATANALVDEVRSVVARAATGDVAAKRIIAQRGWYKNMRQRLRQEFGGLGDVFADLLGALSPNTPVRENWKNAVDFLRRATDGAFDELIPQWEAWSAKVTQEEIAFKAWFDQQLVERGMSAAKFRETPEWKARKAEMSTIRELPDNLIPTKANGKKYGFNGKNAVRATLGLWRVVREADVNIGRGGQAPKALNFSGNLIGFRKGATIDVWAARMLQRLTGRVRVPPPAEQGVGGEMRAEGTTTGAFGYGQDVFAQAAEAIRNDKSLGMPEMGDDDLQAVVWFVEKELWTKNNWTSAAGEGGSFEFEADLQGVAQGTEVDNLRRVMDSSKSTPEEREEAAAALTRLSRTVDRYTVGLSVQQAGGIQGVDVVPTDDAQSVVLQGLRAAIYATANPESVLATKAVSTEGRYFGDVERAVDVEAVVREGFDPTPLWREIVRVAQENNQDSAFLSRVLRAEETMDPMRHRPGIELYLSTTDTSVLEERIAAITEMLVAQDINGFTITMDGRATGAVEGKPGRPIGVRLQYVPEFDRRYSKEVQGLTEEQIAAKLQERGDTMADLAVKLAEEVPDVSFAGRFFYETRVAFSHQYAEELANAGDDTATGVEGGVGPSARRWEGRLLGEGIAATDRQLGIARADAERQAQSRDAAGRNAPRPEDVNLLEQGARGRPNAFIMQGVSQKTIALMNTANLSSLLHEFSHDWLEVLGDLSQGPNATEQTQADYAATLKYLGVTERSQIGVPEQEKFARSFERWLATAEAPSRGLARAFVRFKSWMQRIYRMAQEMLVPVDPEIADVFARMLATDTELAQVRGVLGTEPLFTETDAEQIGKSPEEMAAYQRKVETRTAEETGALLSALLREKSEEAKKIRREREQEIRAEVAEEVAALPVYRMTRFLQTGELPSGTVLAGADKLNREGLEAQYGKDIARTLPRGITSAEGTLDADTMALAFDYRDGFAVVQALQAAPKEKAEVNRIVRERMAQEFPDPMERSDVMRKEAQKAAHRSETDDVLLEELKTLSKTAGIRPPNVQAVKAVARQMLGKEQVKNIRPIVYQNAEAKAARLAGEAWKKGDAAKAAFHKRQQLLNHILYRESVKAVEQVAVIERFARKQEKAASQERLGKAGQEYLEATNAILESVEFRRVTGAVLNRRASINAFVKRSEDESGVTPAIPTSVLQDAAVINYRQLPYDQLVELHQALKQIDHIASLKNKLLKAQKQRTLEQAETAIVESIEKHHDIEVRSPDYAPNIFKRLTDQVKKWDAWHVKPEFLFRWLDGEQPFGAAHSLLFQPIADAQNDEARMLKAAVPEIKRLFALIPKDIRKTYDQKLTGPDIPLGYTREQAVAVALNWGNDSNRAALAGGFLDEAGTMPHLTPRQIQALLKTLTKAEWDFVQGVWDYIDSFWPEISSLQQRLVGVAPEKIEASPFLQTTSDGETISVRGGYYPLSYDREYSWSMRKVDAKQQVQEMAGGGFASKVTKHGHTEERVGSGGKPVDLRLSLFPSHVINVIHDLTHREAVIDVRRLMERSGVRAAINGTAGSQMYDLLNPWLNRVAAEQNGPSSPMENVLGHARVGATMVNMGFKVTTAIVQPLGYMQSVDLLGVKYARRGMQDFLKSPKQIWELVKEWSPELESRRTQFDRDVKDAVDKLGVEGWQPEVMQMAFTMTGMMDMFVAVPTFYGAYLKSMETLDKGNHEAAVKYAESVVRQSQSAGGAKDLAMIQGGPESRRMFTMFYSYFSVLYNLFRRSGGMLAQKGVSDLPRFAGSMALLWFLPAVMGELLAQRGPEDDEDELPWLLEQIARYPFASVVGVRDVAGGIASYLTQGRMFYDISPVVSAFESTIRAGGGAIQAVAGEPMSRAELKAAVEAAGYWGKLPARQMWITGEALYDWMMGYDIAPQDLAFPRPRQ